MSVQGLYCVWDAGNAGGPQYVLESTGQPTACCFSATQVILHNAKRAFHWICRIYGH
jgi:hypothetical protein